MPYALGIAVKPPEIHQPGTNVIHANFWASHVVLQFRWISLHSTSNRIMEKWKIFIDVIVINTKLIFMIIKKQMTHQFYYRQNAHLTSLPFLLLPTTRLPYFHFLTTRSLLPRFLSLWFCSPSKSTLTIDEPRTWGSGRRQQSQAEELRQAVVIDRRSKLLASCQDQHTWHVNEFRKYHNCRLGMGLVMTFVFELNTRDPKMRSG